MTAREKLIDRKILETLSNAAPFMMYVADVLTTVNFGVKPEVIPSEFKQRVAFLEGKARIKQFRHDDDIKLKITDEGEAELQ